MILFVVNFVVTIRWYRKLCPKQDKNNDKPSPELLTAQMRVTPYLLRMTWNGYPLFHHKTKKWGYLMLQQDSLLVNNDVTDNEVDTGHYLEELSSFVKEEHESYGEHFNVLDEKQGPPDDEFMLEFVNQKALYHRLPHKVIL